MLKDDDIRRVETKIAALEQLTSAEFKVIVCAHAWFGLKRKARQLFAKHQLDKTRERNGVLILLVEKDREFLVYGDEGIHSKVGQNFWQDTSAAMMKDFKRGDFAQGLIAGLHQLADVLTIHFPARETKANELSNEILFEK